MKPVWVCIYIVGGCRLWQMTRLLVCPRLEWCVFTVYALLMDSAAPIWNWSGNPDQPAASWGPWSPARLFTIRDLLVITQTIFNRPERWFFFFLSQQSFCWSLACVRPCIHMPETLISDEVSGTLHSPIILEPNMRHFVENEGSVCVFGAASGDLRQSTQLEIGRLFCDAPGRALII